MARPAYDILMKLLLIGDSGVGKTCLLVRYVEDAFMSTFISTIGIDFKIKTIELQGKRIKLQIWDTAGQERFQTITASYYRGAMGIMLVYDVTSRNSFDNIKRWLGNVCQQASPDVERLLVANMCDVSECRAVSHEEGLNKAKEHGIKLLETSAKTGENVGLAFETLTLAILVKNPVEHCSTVTQGHRLVNNPSPRSSSCCGLA